MKRRGWMLSAGLVLLAACHPQSSPGPGAAGPAASATPPRRTAGLLRCEPPPAPETAPHAATGRIPTWRAALGVGTGGLRVDVAGGLVVARLLGGKSVSIDPESGAPCATLVAAPRSSGPAPSIDPYTGQSVPLHGALVGPSGLHVAAVDLATGEPLWRRQFIGLSDDDRDEYALRDGLLAVAAGALDVIGYHVRHLDKDRYRFEEIVAGLDPATGEERWRRAIVQHAWNEPLRFGGDMRLWPDARRALVETPDALIAIDAATGAEAWRAPWPRSRERRAFAGAGRVLVVKPGAALELRDTADGKVLAEMPSPGRAITDAVVRRDSLVVAVERAPGSAFIAAMTASGLVAWKRELAYSAVRLRGSDGDEPSTVHVLDGNARLWTFDERTGAERGSITAGDAYDFALAKTRAGGVRAVLPIDGVTAFDLPPDAQPKALDPFLRWRFEEKAAADGLPLCHADEAEWVDADDQVTWQRKLPARMRADPWARCDEEVASYLRRPRFGASPRMRSSASKRPRRPSPSPTRPASSQ